MNKDVCSLEIAKKLKEAGWDRESFDYFAWFDESKKGLGWVLRDLLRKERYEAVVSGTAFPAPTIGSLLEALPRNIHFEKRGLDDKDNYSVVHPQTRVIHDRNPADALALLYIELKKKGIV